MQAATATVSGFGKLPTHGDFVRHNAGGSAVRALDEWLQRGLYFAQTQRSVSFEQDYDDAPTSGFLFDTGGEDPLVGVMQTSRDKAGRQFPFVIARPWLKQAQESDVTRVPVDFEAFSARAASVGRAIAGGEVGHRDVASFLEQLDGEAIDRSAGASSYSRYLERTTLEDLGRSVWDYFEDSRKYVLFKNLTDTFCEGGAATSLEIGLRFPLDNSAAAPCASFWLELCQRLMQVPFGTVTYFWTLNAPTGDTEPGSLLLFLQPPRPYTLGDVLAFDPPSERVWDLQESGDRPAAMAALAIPPRIGAMLEDDRLSLRDFLAQL